MIKRSEIKDDTSSSSKWADSSDSTSLSVNARDNSYLQHSGGLWLAMWRYECIWSLLNFTQKILGNCKMDYYIILATLKYVLHVFKIDGTSGNKLIRLIVVVRKWSCTSAEGKWFVIDSFSHFTHKQRPWPNSQEKSLQRRPVNLTQTANKLATYSVHLLMQFLPQSNF